MFQGRNWLTETNKCLIGKLKSLYLQTSISCIDLHEVMFRDRIDCIIVSGFCTAVRNLRNRWAIDRGTSRWSFPVVLPDKASLTTSGREYFYRELTSLRRLVGYANYVC